MRAATPAMKSPMTAQAIVRHEVSPGQRPITLVRLRTSSSERSSRLVVNAGPFLSGRSDRGYTGLGSLAASHGLNLDIKAPPAPPMLPPTKPGGKWRKGPRTFTPLRPLYKVENAFARLGM